MQAKETKTYFVRHLHIILLETLFEVPTDKQTKQKHESQDPIYEVKALQHLQQLWYLQILYRYRYCFDAALENLPWYIRSHHNSKYISNYQRFT